MKNRLELAKKLLQRDGVIFAQCDDSEQAYLKVLMDEIFGRENFVATCVWQKKHTRSNDATWLSDNHDFILLYAKNRSIWRPYLLPRPENSADGYTNPDNDTRGVWASGPCHAKTPNPKDIYPVTLPSGRKVMPPKGTSWRFSKKRFAELVSDNRIWFGENGDNIPRYKRFITEVQDGFVPLTLWLRDEVGDNQEGKQEIKLLNFGDIFSTPKPERLIQRILTIATKEGDLVLDFFAGSGTTGAVAHKMNRRYILIEQMGYIHELPEARLKKVIAGEQGGISESVGWKGGGSFVYCELAACNQKYIDAAESAKTDADLVKLVRQVIESDFISANVFTQTLRDSVSTFETWTMEKKRKYITDLLDLNMLYVNLCDMNDEDFAITDADKAFTRSFYGNKP
jgi:adenine-specific DNA-methyltransferase